MKEKKWTWVDNIFMGIRAIWFILVATVLYFGFAGETTFPMSLYLSWIVLAYIIPQLFLNPKFVHLPFYVLSEIVITGSLNVVFAVIDGPGITMLTVISAVIGLYLYKQRIWWHFALINLFISIPLATLILGGLWLQIVIDVSSNTVALIFGVCFNRVVYLLHKTENQRKIINSQKDTLEQYAGQIKKSYNT